MEARTHSGIPLSVVNPKFLESNATSHTWPFSAVAELIDNAYDPDVRAKQFLIDKSTLKDEDCLIFMDNGKGMDYDKMHKMLSFGFSDKQTIKGHVPVGVYGNGFKSGSMRLGKDAIVFSKQGTTMCVGLLSQTYLEKINADNVIVPIVMFTKTRQTVTPEPEHEECLHHILTHSLFNTTEELMSEFSVIASPSGTRIIIWNLHSTPSGKLELKLKKNPSDIQIPVDMYKSRRKINRRQTMEHRSLPESEYSLRAYCSILYLKPRMQIILQGSKVETQGVTKTLSTVVNDTYKPMCGGLTQKTGVKITFGYNTKSKEHYGLMMYHKNRLIKAYERVACQRRANIRGEGVIGVIECNYLTPIHNKQDFENNDEYRNTMKNVGPKLEKYWKEFHYKESCTESFDDTVYCSASEESDDSEVEQNRHQKTYKIHENNQDNMNSLQSPNPAISSFQIRHSTTIISSPDTSSRPPNDTQDPSTSSSKKRSLDQRQETTEKKKPRRQGLDNGTPGSPTVSTASPDTAPSSAMCNSGNDANKTIREVLDRAPNEIKQEVKQLQDKVRQHEKSEEELKRNLDRVKDEYSNLLTDYETLKKDLEVMKREKENVKLSVEDQGVQTDFPREETQQQETQEDIPQSGQGTSNTQTETLRELRQKVGRLLVSFVPVLELQQVNYDCDVIDEILTQVLDDMS